jgi:hypothetical protein
MMERLSLTMHDAALIGMHDPEAKARAGLSLATYANYIAALMALNNMVALRSLDGNPAPAVSTFHESIIYQSWCITDTKHPIYILMDKFSMDTGAHR